MRWPGTTCRMHSFACPRDVHTHPRSALPVPEPCTPDPLFPLTHTQMPLDTASNSQGASLARDSRTSAASFASCSVRKSFHPACLPSLFRSPPSPDSVVTTPKGHPTPSLRYIPQIILESFDCCTRLANTHRGAIQSAILPACREPVLAVALSDGTVLLYRAFLAPATNSAPHGTVTGSAGSDGTGKAALGAPPSLAFRRVHAELPSQAPWVAKPGEPAQLRRCLLRFDDVGEVQVSRYLVALPSGGPPCHCVWNGQEALQQWQLGRCVVHAVWLPWRPCSSGAATISLHMHLSPGTALPALHVGNTDVAVLPGRALR